MSLSAANRRFASFAAAASLLAVAACNAEVSRAADDTNATATTSAADATLPPQTAPTQASEPEGVEPPSASLRGVSGGEAPGSEIPPEQAHGRWQVIDAAGGASGKALVGRTLSFTDAALGWVGTDGKVEPGCSSPFYHIVSETVQVRQFATAFKPGWSRFRLPPSDVGPMHVWECGEGDEIFGPEEPAAGSAFFPVGTDRLVMNWKDGTVLLLRKQGG